MFESFYKSIPGYSANMYSYQRDSGLTETISNFIKDSLFPNLQQQAPLYMSQYDFNLIRQQSQMRQSVNSMLSGYNPMAYSLFQTAASPFGIDTYRYTMNADGTPTGFGRVLGDMFNSTIGSLVGPYGNMANYRNTIKDALKGNIYSDASFGMAGSGLSNFQTNRVLKQILKGTYSDTFYSDKRGVFGASDMIETLRLGHDYNLFTGANVEDIAKRTQGLGKVVQYGMGMFNTTSKEDALRNILEVTGGSISLTNTSKLTETLQKIKSLSRAANISIDIIKETLSRGQAIAKQLDMSGLTGSNLALNSIQGMQILDSIPGAVDTGYTSRAGGTRAVQRGISDFSSQFFASSRIKNVAGLVQTGIELNKQYPNILDNSKIMANLFNGILPNQTERIALKQQIIDVYKAQGMNDQAARITADAAISNNIAKGQEFLSENNPNLAMNATSREILSAMESTYPGNKQITGAINKLLQGNSLTDTEREMLEQPFIDYGTNLLVERQIVGGTAQGRAISQRMFSRLLNSKEVARKEKAAHKQRTRANIEESYLEKIRRNDSSMSRFITGVLGEGKAGDVFAMSIGHLKDELNLRNLTPAELEEVAANAQNIIRTFNGEDGMLLYKAAHNIYGKTGFTGEEALTLTNLSGNIRKGTASELFKKTLQEKLESGQEITLQEAMEAAGFNEINDTSVSQTLGYLQDVGADTSVQNIRKAIKDGKSMGFTKDALNFTFLSNDIITKINNGEEGYGKEKALIDRLKKRLGIEKVTSKADLLHAAKNDKAMKKKIERHFMTEKELIIDIQDRAENTKQLAARYRKNKHMEIKAKKNALRVAALSSPELFKNAELTDQEKEDYLEAYNQLTGDQKDFLAQNAGLYDLPAALMEMEATSVIDISSERDLAGFTYAAQQSMDLDKLKRNRVQFGLDFGERGREELNDEQKKELESVMEVLDKRSIFGKYHILTKDFNATKDDYDRKLENYLNISDISKPVAAEIYHRMNDEAANRIVKQGGNVLQDVIDNISKELPEMGAEIINLMKTHTFNVKSERT